MKKFISSVVLLVLGPLAVLSNASGILQIQGKLTSIGESQYVIETPQSVYYVRRKKVPANEAKKLEKTGVQVSVSLPFEAIDVVKSKKPTS
jgi:hypothetical protein